MEESEPRVIRRYQNRKLYDTQASRYVTLFDIAAMIREGIDIAVIDNRTKKDLTAVTLTQIIFEQEKKEKSILPLAALKRVIQSGSESLQDIVEKLIAPGFNSILQARTEVERVVDRLSRRGKLPDEEKQSLRENFYSGTQKSLEEMSQRIEENVKKFFERTSAVTLLTKKLEKLEQDLEELEKMIK